MENKSKIKNDLKKAILNLPMKIATRSANSTCEWMGFEPKEPENLKKLKKQNGK